MSYKGRGADGTSLQMQGNISRWLAVRQALGATVATSIPADYTSLSAAISNGNTILNVIGDVTEPSNVNVTASGLNVKLHNGANIDMSTNRFVWSTLNDIDIMGNGTITYAIGTNEVFFDVSNTGGRITLDGLRIQNDSVGTSILVNGSGSRFSNCSFDGDLTLSGTRNEIISSEINGNLIISSGSIDCQVGDSQINGTILDNGSGTILADIGFY